LPKPEREKGNWKSSWKPVGMKGKEAWRKIGALSVSLSFIREGGAEERRGDDRTRVKKFEE